MNATLLVETAKNAGRCYPAKANALRARFRVPQKRMACPFSCANRMAPNICVFAPSCSSESFPDCGPSKMDASKHPQHASVTLASSPCACIAKSSGDTVSAPFDKNISACACRPPRCTAVHIARAAARAADGSLPSLPPNRRSAQEAARNAPPPAKDGDRRARAATRGFATHAEITRHPAICTATSLGALPISASAAGNAPRFSATKAFIPCITRAVAARLMLAMTRRVAERSESFPSFESFPSGLAAAHNKSIARCFAAYRFSGGGRCKGQGERRFGCALRFF